MLLLPQYIRRRWWGLLKLIPLPFDGNPDGSVPSDSQDMLRVGHDGVMPRGAERWTRDLARNAVSSNLESTRRAFVGSE